MTGHVTNGGRADPLREWDRRFASKIQEITSRKAGCLLRIIPPHSEWDLYIKTVRSEWPIWRTHLNEYPHCLVVLYAGLAFYDYDDNTFWPHFAASVGAVSLSPGEQGEINACFSAAAASIRLGLKRRDHGTDYVGSAVQYIGVPLSLWDGFLDLCEWALWRKDWKELPMEEWQQTIEKWSGSRTRLRSFLTQNRDVAQTLIQEMLDAREVLERDPSLSAHDVAEISILRSEYFDEVPETASFLRPSNPASLFKDRARVVWSEVRREIYVQLPGISADELPATWVLAGHQQQASQSPDTLALNSAAFDTPLTLTLTTGMRSEVLRLRGVEPWGLFEAESGGRLMNPQRDELPLTSYALVSTQRLSVAQEGFDEDEGLINDEFELKDGTKCFVSRLWPTSAQRALLRIGINGAPTRTIRFRSKARIEARFFAGEGFNAACFARIQDFVKIERWPLLCVSIPHGYFRDAQAEINSQFKVFIDAGAAGGEWSRAGSNDERDYFVWRWSSDRPVRQQVRSGVAQSFRDLRNFFHVPRLQGLRTISVKSPEFVAHYKIFKDEPKRGTEHCWRNLPGAFLPIVLLSQAADGCKWDELLIARDAISPQTRLSYYHVKRYAELGYVEQRGTRWIIRESRACLTHRDATVRLDYCGDLSNLWSLYRRLYYEMRRVSMPVVEVVSERGSIPFLRTMWPAHLGPYIEKYLRGHGVTIGEIVWTH